MILVWSLLGFALWAILVGWLISPWLVLAGGIVICVLLYFLKAPE